MVGSSSAATSPRRTSSRTTNFWSVTSRRTKVRRVPRYIAFLRAINVGGRVIKMEELRRVFAAAGLTNVESFIASGNVLFDTRVTSEEALRKKVEVALAHELGYRVDTFLRKPEEVKRI